MLSTMIEIRYIKITFNRKKNKAALSSRINLQLHLSCNLLMKRNRGAYVYTFLKNIL